MNFTLGMIIRLLLTMIISIVLTPLVRKVAFSVGAVDYPNKRRINKKPMPTMGGTAIFLAFIFAVLVIFRDVIPQSYALKLTICSSIIFVTGVLDDIWELTPWKKFLGTIIAAVVAYSLGMRMDLLSIPFIGEIKLGIWSFPLTILWIVAITHAINLIDGLDGLASGISIIALTTIGIIGYFFLHSSTLYIPITIFVLVAAIAGFFPYNFFPAKIYLGDTGALFLGYMISLLSLQGLKNATFITLITPLFILGVPITDTIYAMIRRKLNKQPIYSADKMHLHHRLISLGFTHQGAVFTIYALAIIFSFIALLMNYISTLGVVLLIIAVLIGLELFAELVGLMGPNRQPILYLLKLIVKKKNNHPE